jgi:two-component system, response regulator YesN
MNILVVDDESLVRTSMSRMIRSLEDQYQVKEVEDGEEAIELLKKQTIDLVITDIRMPVVDGLELATYIHNNFPKTYVILLTGYAEFDYALTALKQGIFDYLLKPASKECIVQAIQKVENQLRERYLQSQIDRLREINVLEKRVQDLLYEIPVPHYDKQLFPSFKAFVVFSMTANTEVLWQRSIRFAIKNVLQDTLTDAGVPVIIVEERQVTTVLFSEHTQIEKLNEIIFQGKQTVQSLLRIELRIGWGGQSNELSDISSLYMKSLKELGIIEFSCSIKGSSSVHRMIRASLDYIESEYASDLTLASLADKLYVNPNYLSKLFKTETGFTFSHYLTHYRIKQAKQLLHDTHLKIYQICKQVGYTDQAYFSRLFKATEGISPYEYREQC